MALKGYATTAITSLTAQNTVSVIAKHDVPSKFIKQQIEAVLSDIGADTIKIGMLSSKEIVEAVAEILAEKAGKIPIVLDTVMLSKSNEELLSQDAVGVLKTKLIPLAELVTPNIPEASVLCGFDIRSLDDMIIAGRKIVEMGTPAVLVKGGHLEGDIIRDALITRKNIRIFEGGRIETVNTHGTGCTLASAIATSMAQKLSLEDSIVRAREYVYEAIQNAQSIGKGYGPLNHSV